MGSLCGRVVEGFLALFCGGSFGGSSAAFCGYASWLAWWWISGASMGIPSSLLSISGLEGWCYETRRFASRCLARLRGDLFERSVRPMFGVICLCWSWTTPRGASARVDARGGVSWRLFLFEELVARGGFGGVGRRSGAAAVMCCFLLWGLWGLWLVLAAACFLRLSRWGFSAWMLTWRGPWGSSWRRLLWLGLSRRGVA